MKSSGASYRLFAVMGLAIVIIGFEAARIAHVRIAEKKVPPNPELASAKIECVTLPPEIVRPANAPAFVDVTRSWGLTFHHTVGPLGTYFMPESVGTGGAFFDYDGDGRLDLYLVQSGRSPNASGDLPAGASFESRLFRQNDRGSFDEATVGSGLAGEGYGIGCAVGDVDNDGDLDVYVTRYEQDSLYLNNGNGTFSDVTVSCGIVEKEWGSCSAFFDYNRDGRLDLIVVNYTSDPTYGHSVGCGTQHHGLVSYCGPHKFLPTVDCLYRNDGVQTNVDGQTTVKFTDVTEAAGLSEVRTYGFGVVCCDFSGDGWPDIFVANDGAANRLWINQRNETFLEQATQRGCATNNYGMAEAGMGVAVGDVNHDGRLDLVVTHLSGERATLYLDTGDGFFEDASERSGVVRPTARHTGWGAGLIDLNHDGELDFVATNGLVIPCHSGFPAHGEDTFQVRHDVIRDSMAYWRVYADQNTLLVGTGNGNFRDGAINGGDFCSAAGSGRSLIHGDIDNDGDVDLVVTNCGGNAKLYRNDFAKAGHWLVVRAFDSGLKRDAYGAEVIVRSKGQSFHMCVNPASSYLASNDVRVHFGLGDFQSYDEIVVKWPDGPVQTASEVFEGGKTNRSIILQRGSGRGMQESP